MLFDDVLNHQQNRINLYKIINIFSHNEGIIALVNTILNDDLSYSSVYFHNSEYTYSNKTIAMQFTNSFMF